MAELSAGPANTSDIDRAQASALMDWSAVLAGALLAAGLSFVLLTFGAAIGLSATSPWPNSGLSTKVIASLAVFWTLAQQIGALMAGGYVAGRLRSQWHARNSAETEFRDGLHGAVVWALAIIFGAILALAAAGALMRSGVEAARTATSTGSTADPVEPALDTMLRPPAGATAPGARAGASAGNARAELSRLLARSVAGGGLSDQDRSYLTQRISQFTGLSQQEAESRVNAAIGETRRAIDEARRAAVLTGLVTAISLLLSLAAAWRAAVKGGQHRDNAIPPTLGLGRRRVVSGT